MTSVTLSPEAVTMLQKGRHSLIDAGPSGHTGWSYWTGDGAQRCVWGHIYHATAADSLDYQGMCQLRQSHLGREIDNAYLMVHGVGVDAHSHMGYAQALAGLEDLILAASRMPDWEPSKVQGSQHEAVN